MTGQEKDDLLIQVTAWAGLTVYAHAHITQVIVQNMNTKSNVSPHCSMS
jgi:hypothetical protein